jgi:hypothetical protein
MSPSTFLDIPREVRQHILRFTRPDYDLRIDCKPSFIGWKYVPHYTHFETQKWVCTLALVNSEVAQDMIWVQKQWIQHGEALARQQKRKKRTRVGVTWTKGSRKADKQAKVYVLCEKLEKRHAARRGPVLVSFGKRFAAKLPSPLGGRVNKTRSYASA